MSDVEKQYCITGLSENHMRVMVEALDTYTRLSLGQLNIVGEKMAHLHQDGLEMHAADVNEKFGDLREELGVILYGMGHPEQHEDGKVAYDVECAIRRALNYGGSHDPKHFPYSGEKSPSVGVG